MARNASIHGMKSASNLILVGPMGAGKSSIGRRLAARFGLPFVDADREIECATGAAIPLIFELAGEAGFREREHEVLARLCRSGPSVIATGGGAVLRADNRRLLSEHGFVVHLDVDPESQLRRLANDRARPLLQRPDRREVLQRLGEERAPLYAEVADLRFETGRGSVRQAAERLAGLLCERWQAPIRPAPDTTP